MWTCGQIYSIYVHYSASSFDIFASQMREGRPLPYITYYICRYEIKAPSEKIIKIVASFVLELQGSLREGALLRVKRVAVEEPA